MAITTKKTWHLVAIVLIAVGAVYVFHMACNHQGQSMVPHFGSS